VEGFLNEAGLEEGGGVGWRGEDALVAGYYGGGHLDGVLGWFMVRCMGVRGEGERDRAQC
jgi:hypothetical protein